MKSNVAHAHIRQIARAEQLSMAKVARAVGIHPKTVSRWGDVSKVVDIDKSTERLLRLIECRPELFRVLVELAE